MELEYKFLIDKDITSEEILKDNFWQNFPSEEWSKHKFIAKYYDDKNSNLSKELIALRVRAEDDNFILTIKTSGKENAEFSQRNEWNIPWTNKEPDLYKILDQIGNNLDNKTFLIFNAIKDSSLYSNMQTNVTRYIKTIYFHNSIIEISLDHGYLQGGNLKDDISELEIELKSGLENDLHQLAKIISRIFNLKPGLESKMSRCIRLKEKSIAREISCL